MAAESDADISKESAPVTEVMICSDLATIP